MRRISKVTGGEFARGVQTHLPTAPKIQPCYIGHSTAAHGPSRSRSGSWWFEIKNHPKNDHQISWNDHHMKQLKQLHVAHPFFFNAKQTRLPEHV